MNVRGRSGGHCEAMVLVSSGVWTRCGKPAIEVHHMLKRSRGGELLDRWTTYHLVALCRTHHRFAEVSGEETGLLIDGYVVTDKQTGLPVYQGSDEGLKREIERIHSEAGQRAEVRAG